MHLLVIESQEKKIKQHRIKLWKLGFKKDTPVRYIGWFSSERKIKRIRKYCKKHKLRFKIQNNYGSRSSSYRKSFLKEFPPNASSTKWFCSYCGKRVDEKRMVVDHLYPIAKVSKDLRLQIKLEDKGIFNVNDVGNLVPSCAKCNSKKGSKLGLWVN